MLKKTQLDKLKLGCILCTLRLKDMKLHINTRMSLIKPPLVLVQYYAIIDFLKLSKQMDLIAPL